MIFDKSLDFVPAKQAGLLDGAWSDDIQKQRPERATKPIVGGNIKTHLAAPQYCGGKFVFHQLAEKELELRAANLEISRERNGEFADPMIEKRRPHFERMGHAHPIHFAQNVVRQVVVKIETQILLELGVSIHAPEQILQRAVFCLQEQSGFLFLGKGTGPENVRLFRRHERALNESPQL